MSSDVHEAFSPLFGIAPRLLILGTFPSPISRGKFEYYGNPQNQFWHIIFDVFQVSFDNPSYEEKTRILTENGIALWDVLVRCEAKSALDSDIRNPAYNTAIPQFVENNKISLVYFNGGNAYTFYKRGIGTIEKNVLPSTSPANARMKYEEKLSRWRAALWQ